MSTTTDHLVNKASLLKKRLSSQHINNDTLEGNQSFEGDELEQYCKKKGLCPLCTKTRTRKRVFQLFKRKNKWELLTLRDKDGSYQVYKGYCVKPTCFTLEQAKRMSGEIVVPTMDPRKRKASRDRSIANPSSIKTDDSDIDSHGEGGVGNVAVHKHRRNAFPPPELRNTSNFVTSDNEPLFVIQKAVEGLANNSNTIRILELSGLNLRRLDFEVLAGGLVASTSLYCLILENSKLDDENLGILASGLERAHDIPLTKLYLRVNQVGDQGIGALCPFLQANTSLEKLDVSRNSVTSLGALLIFSAFLQNRLTRIRSLNLSHNNISDIHDDVSGIEPFLARNRSLWILNLEGNNLRDPSIQALAEGVKKNEHTSLEQLFLTSNDIGDNGAIALATMLEENTSLEVLALGQNKIQNSGARALLAALDVNTTIKDISGLWCNQIERRFIVVAIRKLLLAERSDATHTHLHEQGPPNSLNPLSPVDIAIQLNDHKEASKFGVEVGTVVSTMTNDPDYGEPSMDAIPHNRQVGAPRRGQPAHPEKHKNNDDALHSLDLTIGPPYDRLVIFESTPLTTFDRDTGYHRPLQLHDSDHESCTVREALSQVVTGKIDVEVKIATLDRFTEFFKNLQAHMLHLSCSGPMDRLTLENGYGTVQTLSNHEIKELLAYMKGDLRVVFVSSRCAKSIGNELLDAGVPHVVCCEFDHRFRDPIAIDFIQTFYRALAAKKTLKRAFQIARSVATSSSPARLVRRVHERFKLLPERIDNDPYHNIPVFFAQLVPPNAEAVLSEELYIPSLPEHFVGRELEMYEILEALRGDDIVRIVGPTASGKKSVVAAICHYVWKRRDVFMVDRIFWLPPLDNTIPEADSLYGDLCLCVKLLEKSQSNEWETDALILECRHRIEIELEDLQVILVLDEQEFENRKSSQDGLEKFINFLMNVTNAKILLMASQNPSDCLSLISQVSRDTTELHESTIVVNPLSLKSTARLFGEYCKFITNSGCPAVHTAAEFAELVEPTLRPDSVKITDRQSELYSRMGHGFPSTIISAATSISKEDFMNLIVIANRPEVFVDSLGALEVEVNRRTQEQLQAVDDRNYLRALYLDDLLVELEIMRSDFPSLEELKDEEESVKSKLAKAVNNRRYDMVNELKRELLALKKKIIKEQRNVNDQAETANPKETPNGNDVSAVDMVSKLSRGGWNSHGIPTDQEVTFAVPCGDHRDCSFVVYVGNVWEFEHPSEARGIVCWTNESCQLEGTVVGDTLLRLGGTELEEELVELPFVSEETPYGPVRCATGNAVIVGPSDFGTLGPPCIIFAVGPLPCSVAAYDDDIMTADSLSYIKSMLRSCYRSSMVLAKHAELQALAVTLSSPSDESPAYEDTLRVGLQTLVEEAPFTFLRDLYLVARTSTEAGKIVELLRGMGHRQI